MSDILDSDHLQKILEAAEKVPHGPWHVNKKTYRDYYTYSGNYGKDFYGGEVMANGEEIVDDGSADGEYGVTAEPEMLYYISLLDRDTVTAMVKRLQELEKMCVIALPSKGLV